jgi:hypothetical protein
VSSVAPTAASGPEVRDPLARRAASWVIRYSVWWSAVFAALSAWHAVRQLPSDVRSYRTWILGGLPSWQIPGPYPVLADAVWWPLRWYHGMNPNPVWVLGWTAPATVVACVLLWRTASHPRAAVTVWLLTAAILERSYWVRLDPIAAVFALAAVLMVRRGRIAGSATALSLGALIKVWPAFLLPAMLLGLTGRGRWRWLAWFALPWLLYGAALSVFRPPGATAWFTFTLTRRIQLESVTALGPMWAMALGSHLWKIRYIGGLDSADLVLGPHLRTIHLGLEEIGVVALAVVAVRLGRWLRAQRGPSSPSASAATRGRLFEVILYTQTVVLLVLIFAGPVFSPQYLVWFAPLLTVAAGERLMAAETKIWLVACALTTADYPYLFDALRAGRAYAVADVTLRDAVLAVLLGLCLRRLWARTTSRRLIASDTAA